MLEYVTGVNAALVSPFCCLPKPRPQANSRQCCADARVTALGCENADRDLTVYAVYARMLAAHQLARPNGASFLLPPAGMLAELLLFAKR